MRLLWPGRGEGGPHASDKQGAGASRRNCYRCKYAIADPSHRLASRSDELKVAVRLQPTGSDWPRTVASRQRRLSARHACESCPVSLAQPSLPDGHLACMFRPGARTTRLPSGHRYAVTAPLAPEEVTRSPSTRILGRIQLTNLGRREHTAGVRWNRNKNWEVPIHAERVWRGSE
jgi:hypothetical protein